MRLVYITESKEKSPVVVELEKLGNAVVLSDPSLSNIETAPDAILVELGEDGIPPSSLYWRERGVPLLAVLRGAMPPQQLEKVDDFLMIGASGAEIDLRLQAVRIKAGQAPGERIKADGLIVNVANYEVTVDKEIVDLTYKEFELLKFLATNKGRVLTRDVLLDRVWGYDYFGGTRTVDVHIRRLRAKLGRYESLIETVRNVGYRFKK